VTPYEAQLAVARAGFDPNAAIEAAPHLMEDAAPIESPAGVLAPERHRRHALTLDIEVAPPKPYRRWRFFVFYCLVKLAAWVYPFNFEIHRTREPWE